MTIRVKDLISKKEKMDVVTQKLVPAWKGMPAITDASATVRSYLEKACDYIQDVGVGMVGIYGMGGVGKTSLLKRINNHLLAVGARFDHVIWVVASQNLDINDLQKVIAKKVNFHLNFDETTVEERGESLCNFLGEKKIILFIDDIWQLFELENLGVRFPTNNNENLPCPKVVFTTRSEKVYNEMMAYHKSVSGQKIRVDCLKKDDAWELFLNNVGPTAKSSIDSNEKVHKFAKRVAEKCGGLPLALIVIGRAMSSNVTWNEWEVALDSLSAFDMEELWRKDTDPFPLLKSSYDALPNDTMRKCFLSCSLWPEDAVIDEYDLILRWLGLNLIIDISNFRLAYNKGVTIIQVLKRAGLLEEVEDQLYRSVKMHDIIRGMALWIASNCGTNKNKWIVDCREQEDVTNWGEAEVISLGRSKLKNLPQHPSFPNLSALFLDGSEMPKELDVFFGNMSALKCLDLRNCKIYKIPSSIGCLAGLRFLSLYDLNISLPIELSNLTELKYLCLGYVKSIPYGLISKLKELEFLSIGDYRRWGEEGEASLEELGCSMFGLKALGMNIYTMSMMEQISTNRQVSFWYAFITELVGVTTLPLLEFIRDRDNFQYLCFYGCGDLEEIVVSGQCKLEEFTNLRQLDLFGLDNLVNITWGGEVKPGVVFRNVTVLYIDGCRCLKSITWIGELLYLERFRLFDCENLGQVIGAGVEDEGVSGSGDGGNEIKKEEEEEEEETIMPIFSHLKYLQLLDLPNLTSFSSHKIDFHSLKYLEIYECPRLDLSPFSNHTIHSSS